ncbi:unnamed protein product [Trichobilharzia regenti]|nr:unnamed protein product [Trichobilharzia regenti]
MGMFTSTVYQLVTAVSKNTGMPRIPRKLKDCL